MSEKTIELQILTPIGPVKGADGVPVPKVSLPGSMGEIGILPDHIPFLTPVRPGVLRFESEGKEQQYALGGGFVEVSADGKVTVLSDQVLSSEELDEAEVREKFQECKGRLEQASKVSTETEEFAAIKREFEWLHAQMLLIDPKS